eukprot:5139373-Amphidinium_carterae.1
MPKLSKVELRDFWALSHTLHWTFQPSDMMELQTRSGGVGSGRQKLDLQSMPLRRLDSHH